INQVNPYISKPAKVIAIYRSSCIKKQLSTYFYDWLIDEDDKTKQLKEIFSIFFILAKNSEGYQLDIDDFVQSLRKVINAFPDYPIKVGDKIVIEGTPFGSRHFLRSQSKGIVSNIFGTDDCFVLTDTPTSPGCEGSPIYLKSKKLSSSPVGIVMASLSWWRGEWIGLTLGVTFPALFSDTIPKFQHFKIAFNKSLEHQINNVLYHGLVQIVSGTSWGSGVLLDKENGIIITNSHVIESSSPTILWYDVEINSKIIYKSAENEVYDIAVLAADIIALKKTKMAAVKISRDDILKGETVFAAGFPLFSHATKPKPTLTKGCISHISQGMIKTTCSVLPGSSGGAILRKNGELIGIIACNTRLDDKISAVPRVNMAIPIANIIVPILTYIKTKDPTVLGKLKVDDLPIRK
ncbi:Trypsin, partial [Oryctes borbonicus]